MKEEKRKISLTTYLLSLVIMALVIVCILVACGRMDSKEKAELEEQKSQNQIEILN